MKFRDEESEKLFRFLLGDKEGKQSIEALGEVWHKSKSTYVRQIAGFARAEIQKQNWRKYRFAYRTGIKRFHRLEHTVGIRKKILQSLARLGRRVQKEETSENQVLPRMGAFGRFDFVANMGLLSQMIAEEASFYELEEEMVNYVLFAERAINAIAALNKAVMEESPVPNEDMEMVLATIGVDLMKEEKIVLDEEKESVSLVDVYIQTLPEETSAEQTSQSQTATGGTAD